MNIVTKRRLIRHTEIVQDPNYAGWLWTVLATTDPDDHTSGVWIGGKNVRESRRIARSFAKLFGYKIDFRAYQRGPDMELNPQWLELERKTNGN